MAATPTTTPLLSRSAPQGSIQFFETLSDKLVCMVTSLQKQFEECHAAAQPTYAEGAVLVSIDVPSQTIGVKLEYIEYIKRYGPPPDGIFCQEKLHCLRVELGIDNTCTPDPCSTSSGCATKTC